MLKDSQSHILHLSQLQSVNHKTLDEYRDRLKTYEVIRCCCCCCFLFTLTIRRILFGSANLNPFLPSNVLGVVGPVEAMMPLNVSIVMRSC